MGLNSLEIKEKTNYDFYNICYIDDFNVNLLRITKNESRIGANDCVFLSCHVRVSE